MKRKWNVLVVEDQAMPAELFKQWIQASADFNWVKTIRSAALAEFYCLSSPVDMVLMDIVTLEGASGLDAAMRIKQKKKDIKIILVTSMPECSYLERAKKMGIEGFWYKEISQESILSVMEKVASGEIVYPSSSPSVKLGLALSEEFTKRELEILRLITGGYSNQEIAEKCNISLNTVRNHVANMLLKSGFRNRIELAVRAREAGLVIMDRGEEDF